MGLRFRDLFVAANLSPTQFAVLMYLDGDPRLTQAELARRVLVRPQSVGVLIASLRERGLVVRDGPGGRGRRTGIALTAAGREALDRAWDPVRSFNTPAALGLTPAEAALLDEILDRVRAAVEARHEKHLNDTQPIPWSTSPGRKPTRGEFTARPRD